MNCSSIIGGNFHCQVIKKISNFLFASNITAKRIAIICKSVGNGKEANLMQYLLQYNLSRVIDK
jgi:hypothetical protein